MFETEDDLGDYDNLEDIFLPNLSGGQVNQSEPPVIIESPDPPTRQHHENQSKGFSFLSYTLIVYSINYFFSRKCQIHYITY